MLKAYEYRIYPTQEQEALFNQTLGLCRLYWNTVVFNKNQNHSMQIQGYKPTFEKYKPEALEWAKEASCSIPLAQMWSDVKAALNILSKYVTSRSIVGWEATEITNACGEPRSSVKQESEQISLVF